MNSKVHNNEIVSSDKMYGYERNPAFRIMFADYRKILKSLKIESVVEGNFLLVGNNESNSEWIVHISVIPKQMEVMLRTVMPSLLNYSCSIRIVKDQLLHYNINGGNHGFELVGKSITIYPSTDTESVSIVNWLIEETKLFDGPVADSAIRVGKNIYVESRNRGDKVKKRNVPFPLEDNHSLRRSAWSLLRKWYLPVKLLKSDVKGFVTRGARVKKLDWCLIKQGLPNSAMDNEGRDVRAMLAWEKRVLIDLWKSGVPVPKVYDYFDNKHGAFLVMEYFEGKMLRDVVRDILKERSWKNLNKDERLSIKNLILDFLNIVSKIHSQAYVHRDLTIYNVMIDNSGKMKIIDLQLAYSVARNEPNPHFIMGTNGFVAPEQLAYAYPDYPEDIYSIGVILWFLFTGRIPTDGYRELIKEINQEGMNLIVDNLIVSAIKSCLRLYPNKRPNILELLTITKDIN